MKVSNVPAGRTRLPVKLHSGLTGSRLRRSSAAACMLHAMLICTSASARPPDNDAQITLEPIRVVASRIDNDIESAPANITVIESEQIERSPAKTLPELMSLEAGVLSQSLFGNNAARSQVDIRGFGASGTQNTLVLLDGRRLNDIDLSEINYTAIPIRNIERIEIIRGASAGVLYGEGAVGGAINIVTKRPEVGVSAAELFGSYGSYDTRQIGGAATLGREHFAMNVAGNFLDSDGYRDNNDLRQKSIQADLSAFGDSAELFLKAGASDQQLRLPGERTVDPTIGLNDLDDDRRGAGTPNDYANESSYFLTPGLRTDVLDGAGEFILDSGFRRKNQESFLDFGGGFTDFRDVDLTTWSLTPRVLATHRFFNLAHDWIAGIDFYYYDYDSDQALNPSTINTPVHRLDIAQQSYAAYANDRFELFEGTLLELGGRVQHVRLDAKDDFDPAAPGADFASGAAPFEQSDTEHLYNVGLRHFLTSDLSLFGRTGRSVRFRTVEELFQLSETFVQVFSPLEPQTSVDFDLGAEYSTPTLGASLTGYYMELENEIHFNPLTFQNVNLDPTERYGVEATMMWRLSESLRAVLNYTYLRSKFDAGQFAGNDVPLVPMHTGSVSALWDVNENLMLDATWRYVGEKRFDNDQTNDFGQQVPAYHMLDLRAAQRWGRWQVAFAVNNLLGEEAFDFGVRSTTDPGRYNAYPLPERNFTLTIQREFGQ